MQKTSSLLSWWLGDGGTPDLIPNSEVKPVSADGSPLRARVGRRQDRGLEQKITPKAWFFCFFGSGTIKFFL